MSPSITVLIAAADVLPALKERAETGGGEFLAFTDRDALKALEAITHRRPTVVAIERLFAATPRGAALINRIKADPTLDSSEIRVVSHDSDYVRVSPRRSSAAKPAITPAVVAPPPAAQNLDHRGTRRAPRFKIVPPIDVMVDGDRAMLVDLSTMGAQVLSGAVLKPNQRIRMALSDEQGAVRLNGAVAWASFEIPPSGSPQYRAGIAFLDADATAVAAYCLRHKTS